jgi:hypothetical protein
MKAERVQESGEAFHQDEDGKGEDAEGPEDGETGHGAGPAGQREPKAHHHCPQDFGQLCEKKNGKLK